MNLKDSAHQLKKDVPAVVLALRDPKTPISVKLLAGLTVGYALSPVDLIPDYIPVLGYLDDLIILPLLVLLTVRLIPEEVWKRCQKEAEGMWQDGKPKKWYYAIPVVLLWLLLGYVLVGKLFQKKKGIM